MSIFSYPIFFCFLIFICWFAYERIKIDKSKKSIEADFWKQESEANFSRRKNLDAIEFITIPLDIFPIGKYADENIASIEHTIVSLKDKRILNLTGKTSTQLKLEYGVANLPIVDEYDQNFVQLIQALSQYGQALYDLGYEADAVTVLEYAISIGSDIKASYILLGTIYSSQNQQEKIQTLISNASALDSLMKDPIINALKDISS